MAEIKPDMEDSQSFDAQQMSENIAMGEEEAPKVDVDTDYERSKEYSVSDIDRTGEGAQAAEVATRSDMEMPKAEESTSFEAESTGDPEQFRDMAKNIDRRVES